MVKQNVDIASLPIFDPLLYKKLAEGARRLTKNVPTINGLIGFSPDAEEDLYGIAIQLHKTEHFKESLKVFENLLMLDYSSYRYLYGAAACSHELKQYLAAISYYTLAACSDVTNPNPSFFAGECSLELGKKEAALVFFEDALKKIGESKDYDEMKKRIELLIPALK